MTDPFDLRVSDLLVAHPPLRALLDAHPELGRIARERGSYTVLERHGWRWTGRAWRPSPRARTTFATHTALAVVARRELRDRLWSLGWRRWTWTDRDLVAAARIEAQLAAGAPIEVHA